MTDYRIVTDGEQYVWQEKIGDVWWSGSHPTTLELTRQSLISEKSLAKFGEITEVIETSSE